MHELKMVAENYEAQQISKADVISNLDQLDRSQLIDLLFRQRETIQSLEERLSNERNYMMQQLSQMTDNYNCMRYRHKLKEIRVQEVMAQLKQLKDNHAPCYNRLRGCMMDPGVNRIFEKMKEQIEEHKRAKEDAMNDMQAWTFTSESQAGKRLVARCKKLLQENEEFGKQVTSGNVAKLNTEIEMYKRCIQEMRDKENDYDSLLVEMDEELDAVTCLCKTFEYKLHTKGHDNRKIDIRKDQAKHVSNESKVCITSGRSKTQEKDMSVLDKTLEENTKITEYMDSEPVECKYEFVEVHVPVDEKNQLCSKDMSPLNNAISGRRNETLNFELSNASDRFVGRPELKSSKQSDRFVDLSDSNSSKYSDRFVTESDCQKSKSSEQSFARADFTNQLQCNDNDLKRVTSSKSNVENKMNLKPASIKSEDMKVEFDESNENINFDNDRRRSNKLSEGKHKVKISDAYKDDSVSFGPDQINCVCKVSADETVVKQNKLAKDSGKIEGSKSEILKRHKKRNTSPKEQGTKSSRMGGAVDTKRGSPSDKMFRSRDDVANDNRPKHKGVNVVVPTNNERRETVRYKLSRSPRPRRRLSRSSRSRENRNKARRIGPSPPRYRSDYRSGSGRRRSNSRPRR